MIGSALLPLLFLLLALPQLIEGELLEPVLVSVLLLRPPEEVAQRLAVLLLLGRV